jgi:GT2 family glycosyltransferase
MITVIYSTHKDAQYNAKFKDHLAKTIGVKEYEILEYINHNEYSLAQVYNKGLASAKFDIVICCHNDIKLENGWGKRLLADFGANPDFGIIGKAGSCYFPESGVYWERMQQTMVGQVYHHPPGQNKWLSKYSAKYPFLIPVVTIDGLFMAFDKTKIKHTFDESIGRFHFYDHGFCLRNFLHNVKIGVTFSFEITHESVGQPNSEFFTTKDEFVKKWGNFLPLNLKPTKPFVPEERIKPIKNLGKVAVIIPTKSKLELLFGCINSIVEKSVNVNYEIFVADTGSSDEELNQIKELISSLSNKVKINLIEYDYYNFAKINNDVVKNHVDDTFTHVLFCNNDVVWLSNIIYHMLTIFKEKPLTGTVGGKLFFGDNTIQHDGMVLMKSQVNNVIMPTHFNLYSYYGNNLMDCEVVGNTGALLMIRKNTFIKLGCFNESYTTCFEDVELNIKCVASGLKNIVSAKSIAYHFESQTRTKEKHVLDMEMNDYYRLLSPYIQQNLSKITKYVINY